MSLKWKKSFVSWAGFKPLSPWLPAWYDIHYTIVAAICWFINASRLNIANSWYVFPSSYSTCYLRLLLVNWSGNRVTCDYAWPRHLDMSTTYSAGLCVRVYNEELQQLAFSNVTATVIAMWNKFAVTLPLQKLKPDVSGLQLMSTEC